MKALFVIENKKFEADTFLDSVKLTKENAKRNWYFVITQEHLIILKSNF